MILVTPKIAVAHAYCSSNRCKRNLFNTAKALHNA